MADEPAQLTVVHELRAEGVFHPEAVGIDEIAADGKPAVPESAGDQHRDQAFSSHARILAQRPAGMIANGQAGTPARADPAAASGGSGAAACAAAATARTSRPASAGLIPRARATCFGVRPCSRNRRTRSRRSSGCTELIVEQDHDPRPPSHARPRPARWPQAAELAQERHIRAGRREIPDQLRPGDLRKASQPCQLPGGNTSRVAARPPPRFQLSAS